MSCEYCHSYPHRPGCPLEDEPSVLYQCAECGADIFVGDKYYLVFDEPMCEDCIRHAKKVAGDE